MNKIIILLGVVALFGCTTQEKEKIQALTDCMSVRLSGDQAKIDHVCEGGPESVTIGTQTWTAKNMDAIPSKGNSWCYDNKPENCKTYGRLYDWEAARYVCPAGWRLPDTTDWTTLETFVDASGTVAGTKLKAASGWGTGSGTTAGMDEFGFSALPGGTYNGSAFSSVGSFGSWWTATPYGSYAYTRYMYYYDAFVNHGSSGQYGGFSVRCLKDSN